MSRDRRARRERASRRPASHAAATQPNVPVRASRPSRLRYVFLFLAGLLIGRVAPQSFSAGALDTLDLAMVIGFALVAALSWRAWARRATEDRRREQLERRRAQAEADRTAAAGDTEDDMSGR
ncbi:MAG: hypothetical protein O2919_11400 [Chloroflexi bacterium]|nr:hypothetical protein [Chloroflexota bacterium]